MAQHALGGDIAEVHDLRTVARLPMTNGDDCVRRGRASRYDYGSVRRVNDFAHGQVAVVVMPSKGQGRGTSI